MDVYAMDSVKALCVLLLAPLVCSSWLCLLLFALMALYVLCLLLNSSITPLMAPNDSDTPPFYMVPPITPLAPMWLL